jgi:hypothetical protein
MGEIKSMYNDNLEFDSDNLDLQSIDWEDVGITGTVYLFQFVDG